VMRYVVEAAKPFIVPITHTKGANAARIVDDPLCTITTAKGGENMVAVPALIRTDQQSAAKRNGVQSIEEPVNTLHTSSGIAVMGATIVGAGGRAAQSSPRGLEEPLGTTTGKEDRVLVAAHMTKFNQNGDGYMPSDPLDTVIAGAPRHAVVAANLIQAGYGEREGQAPRTLDIEEPVGAQVAGGGKHAMVAAFLAQHNNDERRVGGVNPGRQADEPLSTVTASGSQQGVIAATLGNMHGSNLTGRPIDEPLSTVSAGGSHAHLILGFLQHYFGSGKQDDDVRQPLGALTGKARYGLVEVMVKGVPHYIDDIGIRMLEPEEGAAAHGFKPGALPDEITIDGKTRRLTKTEKYHLVGNSVPPLMIKLLAECNVRRELVLEAAE
ncbi:DNA cytosine methyltransferase, partial [Mesorhizobium sp. M2A.F.Ca.ET.039.01.1.1]